MTDGAPAMIAFAERNRWIGTGIVAGVATLLVAVWASGCGDGAVEPAPPDPPRPTSVTVTPASAELGALWATTRLSAEVRDQNGQVMAGASVAWSSGNASVATVDASGLVTAVANGSATITATAGSASGTAAVTVAQSVSAVAVTPPADTLVAFGDTVRLVAEATDVNSHRVTAAEFTWASSDTLVARVDVSGLVTAEANGSATITATSGSSSGTAVVTVAQAVSAVTVTPAADTLVAGDTVRLSAVASDANAHAVAGAEFTWASSDTVVAVVDGRGLVTGMAAGEAEITAASSGVTGRAAIAVTALVPTTVAVTPDTVAFSAVGQAMRLAAEVRDQNGQVMAGASVAWSSGNASVAKVDPSGLVTAVANGSATITATAGSASGTAAVTVAQAVSAVAVTPPADTLVAADTVRLSAVASDVNGHGVAGAEFTWASSDTLVAIVDGGGLVTGMAAGEAEITATSSGVTGRAAIAVAALVPTTVAVTPDTVAFTAVGQAMRLAAEVRDQIGRPMEDVAVSWLSGDTLVATVDSTGLVTAAGGGVTTITARAGDATGTALVTVMQSARSITVSPVADTIAPGDTLRLVAEVFDANGHRVRDVEFVWASSDAAVIRVDESGLVTGVGEGRATVTATVGEASAASEITVENPDRAVLVVFYRAMDGPNWTNNDNWLTDAPLREWHGVDTDDSGRVTSLVLEIKWDEEARSWVTGTLSGQLPPELGNLSRLEVLDLKGNNLSGRIPPELGKLDRLRELDLSWNTRLVGPIPPELGKLTELERLELGDNQRMSGRIPPELGRLVNLEDLILHDVPVTGAIPPELGNLVRLTRLDLAETRLSGPIPASFVRLRRLWYLGIEATALCIPGTAELVDWSRGQYPTLWCNDADFAALNALYEKAGGNGWADADGWLADRALERWHGVAADSLGRVLELDLSDNGLTGQLPANLGQLERMTDLRIGNNAALVGRLPASLSTLALSAFQYGGTGLCVPADDTFRQWLGGISSHDGTGKTCAPLSDREVLETLYDATSGANWTDNENWLTDAPLGTWHGVTVDESGRVVRLDLSGNNLEGPIPPELGHLSSLERLFLRGNSLIGEIPPALGNLTRLRQLRLSFNDLVGEIPPELGNLSNVFYDLALWENNLTGSIPPELGKLSGLRWLFLAGNELTGVIPPELGNLGGLETLALWENDLTGAIPPDLGKLTKLEELIVYDNSLDGVIPPDLGRLVSLQELDLDNNNLTGPIPPELGNLARLQELFVRNNDLVGPIPPEMGDLASLELLMLDGNDLTGALPPELGKLSALTLLLLTDNDLTGALPAEFAGLTSLRELHLARNARMSGALPLSMTALGNLEGLLLGGTDLCAPSDQQFVDWLQGVRKQWVAPCLRGPPSMAYLVQAVQSREFPVPLVAGEEALLRVFVTADRQSEAHMPPVRARFHQGGAEIHVANIPGQAVTIPTEVDESRLSHSANAEIPGQVIQPGLELVIEVDPDGTLDPELGVQRRIPETGRLAVDVRSMPVFDLTVIPFLWTEEPDSSIVDIVNAMAADPEGHRLLQETRTLLPVGSLTVTAHEPVLTSSNNGFSVLGQTEAIEAIEGGGRHYLGTIGNGSGPLGVANVGGRSGYARPTGWIIAHELGHNFSLVHPPCGVPFGDPSYPYPVGSVGAWGYDFNRARLVPPGWRDLMSYCSPRWISDYSFTNALRFRLTTEEDDRASNAAAQTRGLLLWGGTDANGIPFLEPAFVVDAPAALPDSSGAHVITGRTATGAELFSLAFTMPEVADGDGSSSFAFVLPTRPGWEGNLASITLSGPGGSFTLDGGSDVPMAILRDPGNGQVRGFLRGPAPAMQVAADAEVTDARGLEVLFSRGIPGTDAWRR